MKNKKISENNIDQILIAEDSPTQAEQLRYILEKHNYKVIVANDGKEALRLVAENKPSLIISDIMMPEMNGYELCKEIKLGESTMEIPVILLTSLTRSEDVLEGISCGADNFITKPYREDYLIAHVEQILANKKIYKNERVRVGVEIMFGGKRRFITASQQQMLTLLISTYEAAVQRNDELVQTHDELEKLNNHLEELVLERTAELSAEIAIRKRSEEQVKKLNRVYSVLSNINQAIVRIHDTKQLLKDACMITVDEGKFQSAWIGIVNKETKKIETSATAGLANNLIEVSPNQNPIANVLKSGKHFFSNNINTDNSIPEIWKQNSISMGFRSFVVFPLIVLEKVIGGFCIYSNEVNFFDAQEINLLNEMATDISFALEFIQREAERKRAEEEIVSQKNKFAQLFENSPIAIALLDDQDKVVQINESFSELFGYFLEEIKGQSLNDIIVPAELKEEANSFSVQTHKGDYVSKESHRMKKDSTLVYVQYVGVPVIINDKIVSSYAMYVDLTQRKDSEDRMKVAKELAEQSDKLKTEFLAQMSHEIRTPINAIVGNTDYLNDLFDESMDADTRDCFDGIGLASKRIIRTVDLILNAAELQTSGYKPNLIKVNLNSEVLNKLYQEHQRFAKQKGLELIYKCEVNETKILADGYSITQIFANLIDNAVKYTKKGKVEVLLTKNKNGNIMVEIKDTGIGMSKEFLSRMFEPFVQEDHGFTRSYDGSGLGLTLVKNYCDINNATIEVESEKNVGTTFRVIFKS